MTRGETVDQLLSVLCRQAQLLDWAPADYKSDSIRFGYRFRTHSRTPAPLRRPFTCKINHLGTAAAMMQLGALADRMSENVRLPARSRRMDPELMIDGVIGPIYF